MENNRRDILILFLLFLGVPLIGYTLYTGNNGNLYGYYLTGFYLIIVLLFSYFISFFWKYNLGKLIIVIGLILYIFTNLKSSISKFNTDIFGPTEIFLQNQLIAVNWIKNDAKDEKFNIDVYVPPVIPYSYDYLFLWNNVKQDDSNVGLLYTLYEVDPPHPERLDVWLKRQEKIGKVVYEEKFGGITVQRRERIKQLIIKN